MKDEACFAPFGLVLDAFIDCMRLTVPVTTFSPSTINAVDTNFDYCEIIYNGMGSAFQLRYDYEQAKLFIILIHKGN